MTPAELKLIAKILAFIIAPQHPILVPGPSENNPLAVPIMMNEPDTRRARRIGEEIEHAYKLFEEEEGSGK